LTKEIIQDFKEIYTMTEQLGKIQYGQLTQTYCSRLEDSGFTVETAQSYVTQLEELDKELRETVNFSDTKEQLKKIRDKNNNSLLNGLLGCIKNNVLLKGIVEQKNWFESLRKTVLQDIRNDLNELNKLNEPKARHIDREHFNKTMKEVDAKLGKIQDDPILEIDIGVEERNKSRQVALEKMKDEINKKFSELEKLERRIEEWGSEIIVEIQTNRKIREAFRVSVEGEKKLKKTMIITQMQFPVKRNFEC